MMFGNKVLNKYDDSEPIPLDFNLTGKLNRQTDTSFYYIWIKSYDLFGVGMHLENLLVKSRIKYALT